MHNITGPGFVVLCSLVSFWSARCTWFLCPYGGSFLSLFILLLIFSLHWTAENCRPWVEYHVVEATQTLPLTSTYCLSSHHLETLSWFSCFSFYSWHILLVFFLQLPAERHLMGGGELPCRSLPLSRFVISAMSTMIIEHMSCKFFW